ncbi:hypothetical protein FHT44_000117 [Mycolicibacterium sp. BK634]|uniref:Ig-like domain-containing protein n=1 Tax=Mycolicibacterium sp. BK634 TaxID=2587099 RepID=UPI001622F953|nr:Ig-like domain-containing protein [Mycolicibacterium sp. BK634]MBB3747656.1 hypothetical protein [Mycolicibacterium sp. BK634]
MTAEHRPAKPLTSSLQGAAKVGAYGGIAVAAWLAGSVATGHGVASADATGTSSGSSSASSAGGSASGGSSTAHAGPRSTGTAKARGTRAAKPAATAKPNESTSSAAATPAASKPAASPAGRGGDRRTALATPQSNVSTAPASVSAQAVPSPFGLLNAAVTTLLNPFLKPPPNTPGPVVPVVWAALGWVRRDLFNQAPTIAYNPTTTVQTGQTVTGNIGATDIEGDALKYTVTQGPKYGTLTIDQATGNFTYTPNDINYSAAQTDSFTISVTDGKFNLLAPFSSHIATSSDDLTVLNPTVQRAILTMPDGVTNPATPRFSADGKSILFAATPTAGGRQEIYQISTDGTDVVCLTCGVSTGITNNFFKPVPFADGSGRILFQSVAANGSYTHAVLEDGVNGRQIVPVLTPASGAPRVIDPQREMRISPDGTHVLFSQIQIGQGGTIAAVPIVGTLTRTTNATTGAAEYHVDDARVVYATGEGKQWTPDGKGVVILGGTYEAGNVDDIVVDLATGNVSRVTANLEYDEDMDYSPNQQWIAIGSTRGYTALSPMDRIVRPAFLPAYIQGSVYQAYATPINVSNQEWIVSQADELNGVNGLPLFVDGDGWNARSMPSWNSDGTAVAFWETALANQGQSRLVVANLQYTTSVGPVAADRSTPNPDWAPKLATYVAGTPPLPSIGTYNGAGGGTAVVSEDTTTNPGHTIRTVTYNNYVNPDGMVLSGTESTDTTASQSSVLYNAAITVAGTHTGSLTANNVTINKLTRTINGQISSELDGNVQVLLDPVEITAAQQGI